jgi:hypothetical protein
MHPAAIAIMNIPWSEIFKHAPKVLAHAKTLLARFRTSKIDPNTVRIQEITEALENLTNIVNEQSKIIEELAEQNSAQYIQIKRNRVMLIAFSCVSGISLA